MAMGRKQRIGPFKQYWEEYSGYKLGEYFKKVDNNKEELIFCKSSWEGYQMNQKLNTKIINL